MTLQRQSKPEGEKNKNKKGKNKKIYTKNPVNGKRKKKKKFF